MTQRQQLARNQFILDFWNLLPQGAAEALAADNIRKGIKDPFKDPESRKMRQSLVATKNALQRKQKGLKGAELQQRIFDRLRQRTDAIARKQERKTAIKPSEGRVLRLVFPDS